MKLFLNFIFVVIACFSATAQKPSINNSSYEDWPLLVQSSQQISNDGKFVCSTYDLNIKGQSELILYNNIGEVLSILKGFYSAEFTEDSQYLIAQNSQQKEVRIIDLNTLNIINFQNARQFKICNTQSNTSVGICIGDSLIVKNLKCGEEKRYLCDGKFSFDQSGNRLILAGKENITLIDQLSAIKKVVWRKPQNVDILDLVMSRDGKSLALITRRDLDIEITLLEFGLNLKSKVINHLATSGLKICDSHVQFSSDNRFLFFKVYDKVDSILNKSDIITDKVDVWNFKDTFIQSQQLENLNNSDNLKLMFCYDLNKNRFIQIEDKNFRLIGRHEGRTALIRSCVNIDESFWNSKPIIKLVKYDTDQPIEFMPIDHRANGALISPGERYVFWTDENTQDFYSYNISTKEIYNITNNLKQASVKISSKDDKFHYYGAIKGDIGLIFQSDFDIWFFEFAKKTSTNISNGFGRKNLVSLKLAIEPSELQSFSLSDSLLLAGIDLKSRKNGFYKVRINSPSSPWIGKQSDKAYFYLYMMGQDRPPYPKKAKYDDTYLLVEQSCIESPTTVTTKDFLTFRSFSRSAPEKKLNWLTNEAINWRYGDVDGYATLYKPENFDSTKVYPIIFHYYETKMYDFHQYRSPSLSCGDLNIPWYVSNGYIVCIPDIVKLPGLPGQAALLAVTSIANYLTDKFKWIDKNKMGLQGHSFGGYETNYLIANTSMFAAAQSSAGLSNLVSGYGALAFGKRSVADVYEIGQVNLRTRPWDDTEGYIRNSPIFNAGKITTPLLMMHNEKDGAVSISQSIEFFLALRRQKKPVWLLQYNDEGHILGNLVNNTLDFNIRQQQFFDHYLKGKPAPRWMLEGVPAKNKGIDSGLQIDAMESTP